AARATSGWRADAAGFLGGGEGIPSGPPCRPRGPLAGPVGRVPDLVGRLRSGGPRGGALPTSAGAAGEPLGSPAPRDRPDTGPRRRAAALPRVGGARPRAGTPDCCRSAPADLSRPSPQKVLYPRVSRDDCQRRRLTPPRGDS